MDKKPILLIVDDNADLLEMYQEILQVDGVTTLAASSGAEALSICENNPNIQVIISDNNMGEMSGLQLLEKIKASYKPMPTFYLLTGAFDISEEKLKSMGGRALILKPFDLEAVLEIIKLDFKL
ncbi:MAG: response regulator [Bacteriovoracaceae bacterium]|nr:response regulator [Bacteriovoracaceae bacterium]